jgi:HD-GYP domain-containing protein (c-di-GMP phosphodiesterase class II)
MGDLVAMLALGQDSSFGQPLETQARSTLLAVWLAEAAGLPGQDRDTAYWAAQLRYLGCTAHAHEVAVFFGDDIQTRARTTVYDASRPAEVLRDAITHGLPERRGLARPGAVAAIVAGGRKFAEMNFRSGCEAADMLAARLGMTRPVRDALACTFERWNGKGQPNGVKGERIPLPMRIVHLAQDAEALARLRSPAEAAAVIRARSGRAYDPGLVDEFLPVAAGMFARLEELDPWDAALACEPGPRRVLSGAALDEALEVVADFADLKSPFMAGHSRQVAALAAAACERAGLPPAEAGRTRRAGLVHDLGRTAVPNSIWDKPGPLTRAERDRVQLHPAFTEKMLRRAAALDALNPVAACHHERADGSGYFKGLRSHQLSPAARILGAADRYQAMTQARAHRPAMSPEVAAAELRRMAAAGEVDGGAAECVLAAAGHAARRPPAPRPAGLTAREAEVLALAASGLTTAQIAERLVISPKTADSHIQHIYAKIGCSTRGAAVLFALEHHLAGQPSAERLRADQGDGGGVLGLAGLVPVAGAVDGELGDLAAGHLDAHELP